MRVAVVADIHGNLSALDAVIADLRVVSPDLVVNGGDLVSGGARPAEVIDRVREMNWPGVYGNADEMLWAPHRVAETLRVPHLRHVRDLLLTHTIPSTIDAVGEARLAWLRTLPLRWTAGELAVVHAVADDAWVGVSPDAPDEELERLYGGLGARNVVYGHIHVPFVRRLPTLTVANCGAVSQSFDGDPRASYLLADDDRLEVRRVEYDVEEECRLLVRAGDPFADSTIATLRTGRYVPVPAAR